jgi:hypothetical protein
MKKAHSSVPLERMFYVAINVFNTSDYNFAEHRELLGDAH